MLTVPTESTAPDLDIFLENEAQLAYSKEQARAGRGGDEGRDKGFFVLIKRQGLNLAALASLGLICKLSHLQTHRDPPVSDSLVLGEHSHLR